MSIIIALTCFITFFCSFAEKVICFEPCGQQMVEDAGRGSDIIFFEQRPTSLGLRFCCVGKRFLEGLVLRFQGCRIPKNGNDVRCCRAQKKGPMTTAVRSLWMSGP